MREVRGGRAAIGVTVAVVLAGLAAAPVYGALATVPAAVAAAAAVLTTRPATRTRFVWVVGAAAAISIAASAAYPRFGAPDAVAVWGYAEMAALLVSVGAVARWAPARQAIGFGAATGVTIAVLVLRLISAGPAVSATAAAIACAIFSMGTAAAAGAGAYLRALDDRRLRSVAGARRDQRLRLAQDLHDFVAHDVSAIVAQAQAGRLIAAGDLQRAVAAFERVEQAGLRALAAMDQAVEALHPNRPADRAPMPGLGELPALTARFSAAGPTRVNLALASDLEMSREVATTAYRIVVEALTNVRRHARDAATVDVELRRTADGGLEVVITDDGTPGPRRAGGARGGLGLSGLADRVRMLDGTFTAGPHEDGWRVLTVLPPAGRQAER